MDVWLRINTLPQSSCTRIFWCKSEKYLSMKINRMWIENKHFASVKLYQYLWVKSEKILSFESGRSKILRKVWKWERCPYKMWMTTWLRQSVYSWFTSCLFLYSSIFHFYIKRFWYNLTVVKCLFSIHICMRSDHGFTLCDICSSNSIVGSRDFVS